MGVEPTTERTRPDTDFEDQEAHQDLTIPTVKDKQPWVACQPSTIKSLGMPITWHSVCLLNIARHCDFGLIFIIKSLRLRNSQTIP